MATSGCLTVHVLTKIRLVIYGSLIFFSVFTFCGVASLMSKSGKCPLYGSVLQGYSSSSCDFVLFVSTVFQLSYCIFRFVSTGLVLMGNIRTELFMFNKRSQRYHVVLEAIFTLFTLISACLLSSASGVKNLCSIAQCDDWYEPSNTAQAGAWISTLLFVIVVVFGYIHLRKTNNMFCQTEAPRQEVTATATSGQLALQMTAPYSQSSISLGHNPSSNASNHQHGEMPENYFLYESSESATVPLEDNPPSYEEAVRNYAYNNGND